MNLSRYTPFYLPLIFMTIWLVACGGAEESEIKEAGGDAPAKEQEVQEELAYAAPGQFINVPPNVRKNLGIKFAQAETRAVARTLRAPGRFEHLESASIAYRVPVAGRIELMVEPFAHVEKGDLLFWINAPEWLDLKQELESAQKTGGVVTDQFRSLDDHIASLQESIAIHTDRLNQLEKLNQIGGGKAGEIAQARATLSGAEVDLAQARQMRSGIEVDVIELKSGNGGQNVRFDRALKKAAAYLAVPDFELLSLIETEEGKVPLWQTLDRVPVRASRHGHIDQIHTASSTWVNAGDPVMSVVDHTATIFRALGLQSDLGLLKDGMATTIFPPSGGDLADLKPIPAQMVLGLDSDPHERTVDIIIYPDHATEWSRPGVAAYAEIVLDASAESSVAIPLKAVITDGLEKIFFKRHADNLDAVARVVADLGVSDGQWVSVNAGLAAGDQVVVEGVYELKLSASEQQQATGHFHSDGTFHEAH